MNNEVVIVSRHPAAIEFIKKYAPVFADAPVLSHATEDDVRDKIVIGNLPLHLASLAKRVIVIEFTGTAPRGQEYTLEDMINAGAVLREYQVKQIPIPLYD